MGSAGEGAGAKYTRDRERLLESYDAVLNRVKELEKEKAVLDEKLRASEAQQQELQKRLSAAVTLIRSPTEKQMEIDSESVQEIRELRSAIGRLITPRTPATPADTSGVDIEELRSTITRLLSRRNSGETTR